MGGYACTGCARVSLVTYTTVIAVRYPELDNVQNDLVCFGNYLLGEQATSAGFLPIFWDAPSAYMHAATDIGTAVDLAATPGDGCLAVLHNRNKMVATFGSSEWVTQSEGAVHGRISAHLWRPTTPAAACNEVANRGNFS